MLHDFTFRDPAEILSELQGGGGLHAGHGMAMVAGAMPDIVRQDTMSMPGMVNDIAFDAMLANDRTMEDPEVVRSEKAGRFRLRIINGAAATNFWIDLGEVTGELIAVDGNAIYPVKGSVFPLAIAQRADIRLSLPQGSGAWPILSGLKDNTARRYCACGRRGGDYQNCAGGTASRHARLVAGKHY